MLCSVTWNIGLKETTWGSLSRRKPNSASDLGPVRRPLPRARAALVVGDEHVLAEQFFFQGGAAGGGVGLPGEPQVFGLVTGYSRWA